MKQDAQVATRGAANPVGSRGEAERREVSSSELFGDARVVLIRHADAVYLLRRTSNGKLILTK